LPGRSVREQEEGTPAPKVRDYWSSCAKR